eukprot:3280808-Pyramimonas_sp.AAC.1
MAQHVLEGDGCACHPGRSVAPFGEILPRHGGARPPQFGQPRLGPAETPGILRVVRRVRREVERRSLHGGPQHVHGPARVLVPQSRSHGGRRCVDPLEDSRRPAQGR